MNSLIALDKQLDPEDILHRAIFTFYENVVEALKENFACYG